MSETIIEPASLTQSAAIEPPTVLFVDDEANILNSLKRLFRPMGYRIFTADGGAAGLQILEQNTIDLVISDMRMPNMNGAQFLEQVRQKWPEAIRILLTGYADVSSTIDAINKGEIYRYIAKPWDDNDIVLVVKQALELKNLELEKQRLEALTVKQNEELKDLNANLEAKVMARTEEVRQTMGFLEVAHKKLKEGYLTSLKVFSNLMELREGAMGGHSRRVADHARRLAQRLGLSDSEVQDVMFAGLLHDVGKIGLPDHLLHKPFSALTNEERAEVVKHPVTGQAALMALENMKEAAKLIRSHHERFDGLGFPDGLSGMSIPKGARILAVANDYDALQIGSLLSKQLTETEARDFLREGRGKRYDPKVTDVFLELLGGVDPSAYGGPEMKIATAALCGGMVLARDLLSPEGLLLLSKGHLLDDAMIGQILEFEHTEGKPLTVYIRPGKE
ncbi:response regulator receiver modulated metal dependent phosphohydrolase [Sulfuricella denitrificans skB26]|uniref:Response regulator receiver modulated metal dependent phosphohydrolase n=1 Tax=Sulfuricella denitrificans (strain DSM 22764 / NBRC 105220 / skB26) TaxID=1163617 RepID=S6B6G9_SULDS|nr:HD domain-containing phosphohydrolase [Sulfuricella denitrificans]BAN36102.1 response regulator receiver modulated metal dependent phosphohydrolase [Sulfuricella denitrificans skB26]